jgi:predicted transcriptional regulator
MSRQRLRQINKDRKSTSEVRRARMQKLSALGKSAAEIAKTEGVAVQTVHNNLVLARKEASPIANAIREEADGELRVLLSFIKQSEEMTDAEIVREIRATWKDLRELHGADEPTRSESVNVNVDGQNVGPYRKFVQACSGLELDQIEQLFVMAREMPRRTRPLPEPPTTSPLWVKQLDGQNENQ